MTELAARIPMGRLWPLKVWIAFRDDPSRAPEDRFFDLVRRFSAGKRVDTIEVVQDQGNYVILNGV